MGLATSLLIPEEVKILYQDLMKYLWVLSHLHTGESSLPIIGLWSAKRSNTTTLALKEIREGVGREDDHLVLNRWKVIEVHGKGATETNWEIESIVWNFHTTCLSRS